MDAKLAGCPKLVRRVRKSGTTQPNRITTMRLIRYSYPSVLTPSLGAFNRSPWSGFETEMDRLFETTPPGFDGSTNPNRFPVDLFEDKENAYVRAELPGVNRDDIQVEMAEGELTITAARKQANDRGEEAVSFTRTVGIESDIQADKVAAVYENGVLTVTLPKREEVKPKKVTVAIK
jgi:HSP20 family protein